MNADVLNMKKGNEKMFDGKFKFLVVELLLLRDVLNTRTNRGYGIKDIRLIDKTAKVIDALIPEQPAQMDQTKANEYGMQEVECELTQTNHEIIKMLFSGFGGFLNDPNGRNTIINLADKLGIK
jgi:hypothetical protein